MAGFPSSTFLTLYLTAIVFLQGADLSLETEATPVVTMPGSDASGAVVKLPAQKGKSKDVLQISARQSCPNCNKNNENEESVIYKLRLEMIKAKILAKLQLDKEPVIKEKLKENRIAALLSNLNLIEEENDDGRPTDTEDEYYGKTTKIIFFSEKANVPPASRTKRNSSGRLIFHFKMERNSLPSSLPSALLWIHIRKSKRRELEGRFLHIEALSSKTERDVRVVRSKVKKERKSGSGWIVVNVKDIVQHWFNKTAPAYFNETVHGLEITCHDCETETNQLISSRGRLRPFLVIDLEKSRASSRRKRQPQDCVGTEPALECCRRRLYVNFTEIGWDWIIYPTGFNANFCEGSCKSQISPIDAHSFMLQEISERKINERLSICCTPSKMSALSLLHFDDYERIIKRDVPNMRVDACGCT